MVRGGVRFWWPLWKILTSVPHVEQFLTLSLISSGPHVGSGTSSMRTSSGAWGLITALFIEVGWITLIGDKIFGYEGGYGFVEDLGG